MECSLYGLLPTHSALTPALHSRLHSLSIDSEPFSKQVRVYQTSMGTRSSSMARLEAWEGGGRRVLRNLMAADTTQNSFTSVISCNQAIVEEGDVEGMLQSMGFK